MTAEVIVGRTHSADTAKVCGLAGECMVEQVKQLVHEFWGQRVLVTIHRIDTATTIEGAEAQIAARHAAVDIHPI